MAEKKDQTEKPKVEKPTVDRHAFYFETPLYTVIAADQLSEDVWKGELDAFSPQYKTPTTFTVNSHQLAEDYYHEYNGMYRVTLENKRKENEKLVFFVALFEDGGVYKMGQFPSLATIQTAEISEKYRKVLDAKYSTFTMAVGLAAHGVGAGSLVYLRKIFSDLIDEAYQKHSSDLSISTEDYKLLRMDGRVDALKEYLPAQLVDMKGIYGILSSGVHDLSEQDCKLYFGPLRLSIELILDEIIEDKAKKDREASVKKELQKIQQAIKSPKKAGE